MAGGHLLVQLPHGAVQGHVTVLLVHVVVAGARLVAHPDAKVLDGGGLALENLAWGYMRMNKDSKAMMGAGAEPCDVEDGGQNDGDGTNRGNNAENRID